MLSFIQETYQPSDLKFGLPVFRLVKKLAKELNHPAVDVCCL